MKTYCTNCGFKIDHQASQKPNFCPKCGHSFTGASVQQDDQIYEENEEVDNTINVDENFELEFELLEKPKASNKLSDLMGTSEGTTSAGQSKAKRGRGRPKKINKKEVWQSFKEEAGGNPHRETNE